MPRALGGNWARNIVAVSGTTRTVTAADCGTVFTNRGGSAGVTFTLPVTSPSLAGFWCEFYTVAAQILTIASSPADNLVNHADAGGDTIASAATIGQHFTVICDGTGWLVVSDPSAATTATAVTAVTLVS